MFSKMRGELDKNVALSEGETIHRFFRRRINASLYREAKPVIMSLYEKANPEVSESNTQGLIFLSRTKMISSEVIKFV